MKQVLAVILAAIIAGLAACEIATTNGIRGIPANVNSWLSGEKTPVVEAAVTDTAKEKAKDVVAKVQDVAEKAVDAAKLTDTHHPPAPLGEPGATSFFGVHETADADQPWAAAATVIETPAVSAAEPASDASTEAPSADAAESTPSDPSAFHDPAPLGEPGATSLYGVRETADADQPWAAAATVFEAPAASAAEPASDASTEAPSAEAEESTPSDPSAFHDPAPLGEPGATSLYGVRETADADQPWAAAATVFEAPAASAAEPASDASTEAPSAEAEESTPSDPSAFHDPAPLGEPGATSLYGVRETADADQPWAAAATVNADAAPPAPAAGEATADAAAASPELQQAVEACRDAVSGELPEGIVTFALGSWDITPEYYAPLDRAARAAKDCKGVVIEISGHADDTGKEAFNQTLSELRAETVMRYLVKEGVDAAQLKAVGYGQAKPAASNDTVSGRAKNRRIEVSVKPQ